MWSEFKKFAMRGNAIDLAVGIVLGAAFGKIIDDLVHGVIMPPFGWALNGVNFQDLFYSLDGKQYASLAQAQQQGAPVITWGLVVNDIITFLIVAFVIFLVVRWINRLQSPPTKDHDKPTTKNCPYCKLTIPIEATRCPECTSHLDGTEEEQHQKAQVDVRVHTV